MLIEKPNMFCGLALGRKRKMTTMETDDSYVRSKSPETMTESIEVELPWWADVIESTELAHVIRSPHDQKVLLVDCRSFLEFNQSNIVNSVNVCCNKIVKRRLQQNKVKIQEFLSSTCHIEIDRTYTVVVYDRSTTDASTLADDDIVAILGTKCKQAFSRVRVLYGGFLEFQAQHPSLLETKTKTPCQQSASSLSQPCMPVTNIGPTKILPYLFLGSMKDCLSADVAKANGITYVLNVSMSCPKPSHIQDGHFLRIPVNDSYSEKLLPYFHEAFQFIDKVREANGCVLVHCLAGISRSPTLAIAYIMRSYNMASEEAYRYVKEKRVTISPNFNFLGQLLEYEQQISRHDSSQLAGSKRRCIDDLRAELSSPGSPLATPRLGQKVNAADATPQLCKASSPTNALSRLKFEHKMSVSGSQMARGSQSPTTAFAKLRFANIASDGAAHSLNLPARVAEEPEFYVSNVTHSVSSANSSPCTTPTHSSSVHILNSNCNNNSGHFAEDGSDRSPSPTSYAVRPSRPMSLSLSTADTFSPKAAVKRPVSLGIQLLEGASVALPTECKADEQTLTVDEATPPSENGGVEAVSLSRQPCEGVQLRRKVTEQRTRPKSMAFIESSSPKEKPPTPLTPTQEPVTPQTAPVTTLDMMILGYTSESQRKSRSLENVISHGNDLATERRCHLCLANVCKCGSKFPAVSSAGSMSSAGSHSSLHGSLELIPVS